jgi:hypothetical protein
MELLHQTTTLKLVKVIFSPCLSNTVDVFGGGLLNEGSATVTSSTLSGNQAVGGGGTSFFRGQRRRRHR